MTLKHIILTALCILMSSPTFAAETKLISTESFKTKFEEIKAKMSKVGKPESKAIPAVPAAPVEGSKPSKSKVTLPDVSKEDEKAEGEVKEETGLIVARNHHGLAVEYAFDKKNSAAQEIWVNFNKKMKLSGVKDLSQLGEGDTVRIQYKVTKAEKKIILKAIELIRKKSKEAKELQDALVSDAAPEAQS